MNRVYFFDTKVSKCDILFQPTTTRPRVRNRCDPTPLFFRFVRKVFETNLSRGGEGGTFRNGFLCKKIVSRQSESAFAQERRSFAELSEDESANPLFASRGLFTVERPSEGSKKREKRLLESWAWLWVCGWAG